MKNLLLAVLFGFASLVGYSSAHAGGEKFGDDFPNSTANSKFFIFNLVVSFTGTFSIA